MGIKSSKAATGAPRWTYVVGAIVAVGGLIWGIVNHFIDKPQPASGVPTQQATADGGNAINASGSAKVSIGGQVTDDATLTAHAAPSMPSVPEEQQTAEAGNAGVAVNAAGTSEVKVEAPTDTK